MVVIGLSWTLKGGNVWPLRPSYNETQQRRPEVIFQLHEDSRPPNQMFVEVLERVVPIKIQTKYGFCWVLLDLDTNLAITDILYQGPITLMSLICLWEIRMQLMKSWYYTALWNFSRFKRVFFRESWRGSKTFALERSVLFQFFRQWQGGK